MKKPALAPQKQPDARPLLDRLADIAEKYRDPLADAEASFKKAAHAVVEYETELVKFRTLCTESWLTYLELLKQERTEVAVLLGEIFKQPDAASERGGKNE